MTIPHVRLSGTAYERGWQHGHALGDRLRGFLADGLARIDRILPQPLARDSLAATLHAYDRAISTSAPELGAEIGGLADGAGLSRAEAVLLQVRRELIGYHRIPAMGDCTTYARPGADPVLAQTVDLNGVRVH